MGRDGVVTQQNKRSVLFFKNVWLYFFLPLAGSTKWGNQTLLLHGAGHYSVCLLGKLFHKMRIYVSTL